MSCERKPLKVQVSLKVFYELYDGGDHTRLYSPSLLDWDKLDWCHQQ